jgi:hypothetical protein
VRRPSGALAAGVALLCAAAPGPATAHTYNGALAGAAASTDYFQVACLNNGTGAPRSLVVRILDASPGPLEPLVSIQLQRGELLTNTSDTAGEDSTPSPSVWLNIAPGEENQVHYLLVDKTAAGIKYYSLVYHCYTGADGGGVEAGSSMFVLQNQ